MLAGAYAELADAVREQPVVHGDETGWRWPGLRRWAWLASTEQIAVYHLTDSRAARVAKDLLGEDFPGVLVSDRYGGYAWIDPGSVPGMFLNGYTTIADMRQHHLFRAPSTSHGGS